MPNVAINKSFESTWYLYEVEVGNLITKEINGPTVFSLTMTQGSPLTNLTLGGLDLVF